MDIAQQLHRVETLIKTMAILEGQYNDPECDIEDKCIELFTSLVTIKERMADLRGILLKTVDQIKITEAKIHDLRTLNLRIEHIRNQLPEDSDENGFEPKRLVMDNNETASQTYASPVPKSWSNLMSPSPCVSKSNAAPLTNGIVSKHEDHLPQISYVTEAEVNTVPKYMRGRCNANSINKLIESLNMAFKTKYETLSKPKKAIKQKDLEHYYEWKRTENLEPKGTHFITTNDANLFGTMKMDKACFNMITILRHLKRLKENRHAKNQVHYVII